MFFMINEFMHVAGNGTLTVTRALTQKQTNLKQFSSKEAPKL